MLQLVMALNSPACGSKPHPTRRPSGLSFNGWGRWTGWRALRDSNPCRRRERAWKASI